MELSSLQIQTKKTRLKLLRLQQWTGMAKSFHGTLTMYFAKFRHSRLLDVRYVFRFDVPKNCFENYYFEFS